MKGALGKKKDKPMDVRIKVAIIGAIGLVAAFGISSPLTNTAYTDRPLVDISLGSGEDLPKEELQYDGTNYYVEIAMKNRGNSDGKIFVSVFGDNTDVSFIENGPYQNFAQLSYVVFPDVETKTSKFYVKPHEDVERFTVRISAEDNTGSSYFQEVNSFIPTELTYKKSGDKYVLIDKR